MRITLKDVAKRCGTSIHTVSKVLTGKADLFPAKTRERVQAAVDELGYLPNASARATRSGRFGQVGVVSGIGAPSGHLPAALLGGVIDVLRDHGLSLLMSRLPNDQLSDSTFVRSLHRSLMVDGLLINYQFDIPPLLGELLTKNAVPSVWLNVDRAHDSVHPDDRGGARMLTEHLLQLGHRRIAYLDWTHKPGDEHYSIAARKAGYDDAMRAARRQPRVSDSYITFDQRPSAVRALLDTKDRPTAIITYASELLVPVWVGATAMGLEVPRQLSLAAFEDAGAWTLDHTPSKMLLPWETIGRAATTMLLAKLGQAGPQPKVAVPLALNPGHSCPPG